jgi:hypothetical protein
VDIEFTPIPRDNREYLAKTQLFSIFFEYHPSLRAYVGLI